MSVFEMIGDDECMFGHEAADVNMVSYAEMQLPWHWETSAFNFCIYMHAITSRERVSYPFGKSKVSSLKIIMYSDGLELKYSVSRMHLYRM